MHFRAVGAFALAGLAAPVMGSVSTSATYSGNVDAVLAAYAEVGVSSTSGTLSVSGIPSGSTIRAAYLYTNSWFDGGGAPSATFAGTSVGSTGVYDSEPDGVYAYRWDVTGLVTGDGSYSVDIGTLTQIYGAALAVVYEHSSLPLGTVYLNDGVSSVDASGPESTLFAGVGADGPGHMQIYTEADNALGETDEQILFNGDVVGGPIDENLGSYASLFDLPVSVKAGDNTATITSPADYFGWHVALLTAGEIPAPGTGALFALGGLALARRRR